jgi:hypothetical protein
LSHCSIRGDQHHTKCAAALAELREPLATVWPPFVEAMHLLSDLPLAQEALWEMPERGAVFLLPLDSSDVPRIRELMRKYANRPMDLAEATLLRVAEREGLHKSSPSAAAISRSTVSTIVRALPSFHNSQSGAKLFIPPFAPRRPILECQF